MSVLIKGMKMPESCNDCTFGEWSILHQTACCKLLEYVACFKDFSREYKTARSERCPLVEIKTPHGRLVDADDLITAFPPGESVRTESVRATIEHMLTIQPGIIHCKDCEYGAQDEYGRWYCHSLGCQIGDEDGSGFCASAERRSE